MSIERTTGHVDRHENGDECGCNKSHHDANADLIPFETTLSLFNMVLAIDFQG
jgi:hypothetical protein